MSQSTISWPGQAPSSQIIALLNGGEDAPPDVNLDLQPATVRATDTLRTKIQAFEYSVEVQRKLLFASFADQLKPLYVTRSLEMARKLTQKGEFVAHLHRRQRKNSQWFYERHDSCLQTFTRAIFLLDEYAVFDWSVYMFASRLFSELKSGPLAKFCPKESRVLIRWEPQDPKLSRPGAQGQTPPTEWEATGNAESDALKTLLSVAPILRGWKKGIKDLATMTLDASETFRDGIVRNCLHTMGISGKEFSRCEQAEKHRRQLSAERKAAMIVTKQ